VPSYGSKVPAEMIVVLAAAISANSSTVNALLVP
jgi:hypothetical protein